MRKKRHLLSWLLTLAMLLSVLPTAAFADEVIQEQPVQEETNQEETNQEETKQEETKQEEIKQEEVDKDETKTDETTELVGNGIARTTDSGVTAGVFLWNPTSQTITGIVQDQHPTEITIPKTIKNGSTYVEILNIADDAFSGRTNLTTVNFEADSNITTIGESAFKNTGITSITLPDSVTSVGSEAFSGCTSLTTVSGGKMTEIASNTFNGCSALKSCTIPNTVTSIGGSAFANTGLTSIDIPNSVTSIGWNAFYQANLTSVTIPNSVISIESNAFEQTNLTSVTIPDSVTSIGYGAFEYCYELSTATLPNNTTFTEIPSRLFYCCRNLKTITIPDNVTKINSSAFGGCSSLKTINIPDNMTVINSSAFSDCSSLTSITIPDKVTEIGSGAFSSCRGLTEITIPSSVTSISSNAFQDCTNLKTITVNQNKADTQLTGEPWSAPYATVVWKDQTTKVVEGKGTYIYRTEKDAENNDVITIVKFLPKEDATDIELDIKTDFATEASKIKTIGDYAFSGCKTIKSVTLPDSLTSIGQYAFYECSSLQTISTLPDSLISIGQYAFGSCYKLESVTFGTDSKLSTLGSYAFYRCSKLTNFTIPSGVKTIAGWAFAYSGLTTVTIPEGVETIGSEAFYYAKLTSVTIPTTVTTIESYAFECCDSLQSVTFTEPAAGETAKPLAINYSAFWRDSGLTGTFIVPARTTSIGSNAFYGTSNLEKIHINKARDTISGAPWDATCVVEWSDTIQIMNADNSKVLWTFEKLQDSETNVKLTGYFGTDTTIDIQQALNTAYPNAHYIVTEIGDSALKGRTQLTSVTIPSTVTKIGQYAFRDCTGLTSVNIPSMVSEIASYAFYNCTGLQTLTLNYGLTTMGGYAFYGCTRLTSVAIPDSVTSMSDSVFAGCTALTAAKLSKNMTYVAGRIFGDCTSLKDVTIPSGVTNIEWWAFENTALETIEIPSTVQSLSSNAFSGCSKLKTIKVDWAENACPFKAYAPWGATSKPTVTYSGFQPEVSYTLEYDEENKQYKLDLHVEYPDRNDAITSVWLYDDAWATEDEDGTMVKQGIKIFGGTESTGSKKYSYDTRAEGGTLTIDSSGHHVYTIYTTGLSNANAALGDITEPSDAMYQIEIKIGKAKELNVKSPLGYHKEDLANLTEDQLLVAAGLAADEDTRKKNAADEFGREPEYVRLNQGDSTAATSIPSDLEKVKALEPGESTTITVTAGPTWKDQGVSGETVSVPVEVICYPDEIEVYSISTAVASGQSTWGSVTASPVMILANQSESNRNTTLQATAKTGYEFDYWEIEGTFSNELNEWDKKSSYLTLQGVSSNITATAHFKIKEYSVNVDIYKYGYDGYWDWDPETDTEYWYSYLDWIYDSEGESGSITPAQYNIVQRGKSITLTAVPNRRYTFDHWEDYDGVLTEEDLTNPTITLKNVRGYIYLGAYFKNDGKTGNGGASTGADFIVNKTDADGKALSGATFVLTNKKGVTVYKATSDKDGVARFTDVADGSYTLTEKSAPSGYQASKDSYELTVSSSRVTMNGKSYSAVTFVNEAATQVDAAEHMAFLAGYKDGTFGPDRNMTRAEVTTMFARLLPEKMDASKTYTNSFSDVPATHWAANYIGYMEQFGIISGYTDGTFRPDASVSRAEFASIVSRFGNLTESSDSKGFPDVPESSWAAKHINMAAAHGWVSGYEDGTFRPNNSITRAEVASVVCRMLGRSADLDYIKANPSALRSFGDVAESHWAYKVIMEAANAHNYIMENDVEKWQDIAG